MIRMARSVTLQVVVALVVLGVGACGGSPVPEMQASKVPAAETSPQAQCPPDLTAPIYVRMCPDARVSADGKVEPGSVPLLEQPGAHDVIIMVTGAAPTCAFPSCRDASCPAQDALTGYWAAENLASQKCVRDLITSVGGTSTDESFWLIDVLVATLTWEQIQVVATHPHVLDIESNQGGPPP
jgi:hypothetical protein